MTEALYIAASGAVAQEIRMGMLSNNLANMHAAGYKADALRFKAFLPGGENEATETAAPAGGTRTPLVMNNYHVQQDGMETDFAQGSLKPTGNALDFALQGDGFFVVQGPEQPLYTRKGSFKLSPEGVLVTHEGYPVQGEGGEIRIRGQKVRVDESGRIEIDGVDAGRFKLVDFPKPYALSKQKGTFFFPAKEELLPQEVGDLTVHQGFLENSNVKPVATMAEMIEVMRAYESYQKVILTLGEVESKLIGEVGRMA